MSNFVEENLASMKKDLGSLVSFNSVNSDDCPPFGQANREVLDTALSLMEEKGLKTNNLDYYCGYGEVGEGEKLIGIVCHLDVVPAGTGWDSNPFEMIEKDGYLYGRGVSDDKGAVIASLYALKYLIDTKYEFKKRVRLIVGCNEETGSRCIAHYVEKCGHIDLGFTPDGNFPGIYAEKGMVGGRLIGPDGSIFLALEGGEAGNVVCKKVSCELPTGFFDEYIFKDFLDSKNIQYELKTSQTTKISVYGKAAHASMPDLGVNAINYLLEGLFLAGLDDPFVENFHKNIGLSLHGEKLGLNEIEDDISNASVNIGVIGLKNGHVECSVDCRFPVKSKADVAIKYFDALNDFGCHFMGHGIDPLYFDIDSPMIKALKKAYEDVTGDKESKMEAIGGGTYAKSINNCIAFGCEFQGEDNHIHDANEKLSIESFKKQVDIYIQAIKNLNEI